MVRANGCDWGQKELDLEDMVVRSMTVAMDWPDSRQWTQIEAVKLMCFEDFMW